MRLKASALAFAFACLLWASPNAMAGLTEFDEFGPTPVDGITFKGITYSFTIGGFSSTDATFGGFGPGTQVFVDDPTLEGNAAGELRLDFTTPEQFLMFGFAIDIPTSAPQPLGVVTVKTYDATLTLVNTTTLPGLNTGNTFYENLYIYNLSPEISRAVITWDSHQFNRFAIDNIKTIPEPGTLALLGIGAAGFMIRRRRRAKKAA